jgi:hypothetical protein
MRARFLLDMDSPTLGRPIKTGLETLSFGEWWIPTKMNSEPLWRTTLCWIAVFTFFALPLVLFIYQVFRIVPDPLHEFGWVGNVYKADAALVFGLAGLNSWDKRNGVKKEEK